MEPTFERAASGAHRPAAARRGPRQAGVTSGRPFVSVVMPVRNERAFIPRSLGAVLSQDYPAAQVEVLVADGTSDDGTAEFVREFMATDPRVRLVENPGRIVSTGLNAALRQARGSVIVRVDGHCEIAPDYVSRCVDHLERGEAEGVGGPLETIGQDGVSSIIARAMSSQFGVGGSDFRTTSGKTAYVDTVAFPAYLRDAIDRAGPFDEELVRNQDDEYNCRLRSKGGRILLAADVHARYYARSSFGSLWRQYRQYGYWKVRVLQKHPRLMSFRHFVPPTFVAVLVTLAVASLFSAPSRVLLAGVLALYAGAVLLATAMTARHIDPEILGLPLAFVILHVSYGSGFLVGLAKFRDRWRDRSTRGSLRENIAGVDS